MNSSERNSFLDVTRIVAVLAVVMIHTSASFVTSYPPPPSLEFLWGNIFDSISRIGVPLFVMISGSLMLDKARNISVRNLLFVNIKSVVCLLLFWSALYCGVYNIVLPLIRGKTINFSSILYSFVMGHYHLWYLYMIIGLYLITPFLREFVKEENKHLILLFIFISLIAQFTLPLLNGLSLIQEEIAYLVKFIEKFHLGFFGEFITYYLIGWYVIHIGIKKKWRFYCLGMASLLLIILYVQITQDYSNGYSNRNMFVLLYSVSVFIGLNCEPKWKINEQSKKMLEVLSKLSFGVYIIHPLFLSVVCKVFPYAENPFLYILFCFVTVTVLSFISCFIASKLPVIKKAIRM